MFDSFDIEGGATKWFPWEAGSGNWCRFSSRRRPSCGWGSRAGRATATAPSGSSSSSTSPGWLPAPTRCAARANPDGHLIEADPSDDVHEEQRVVPGVVASPPPCSRRRAARRASGVRRGRSRRRSRPAGRRTARPAAVESCYLRITAGSPLTYEVASGPSHGAASSGGARLTYESAAGFVGRRLADVRGDRRPRPAQRARHGRRERVPAQAAAAARHRAVRPRRLLLLGHVRRVAPKRLAVRLLCRPAALGGVRGHARGRVAGPPRRPEPLLRARPGPAAHGRAAAAAFRRRAGWCSAPWSATAGGRASPPGASCPGASCSSAGTLVGLRPRRGRRRGRLVVRPVAWATASGLLRGRRGCPVSRVQEWNLQPEPGTFTLLACNPRPTPPPLGATPLRGLALPATPSAPAKASARARRDLAGTHS